MHQSLPHATGKTLGRRKRALDTMGPHSGLPCGLLISAALIKQASVTVTPLCN